VQPGSVVAEGHLSRENKIFVRFVRPVPDFIKKFDKGTGEVYDDDSDDDENISSRDNCYNFNSSHLNVKKNDVTQSKYGFWVPAAYAFSFASFSANKMLQNEKIAEDKVLQKKMSQAIKNCNQEKREMPRNAFESGTLLKRCFRKLKGGGSPLDGVKFTGAFKQIAVPPTLKDSSRGNLLRNKRSPTPTRQDVDGVKRPKRENICDISANCFENGVTQTTNETTNTKTWQVSQQASRENENEERSDDYCCIVAALLSGRSACCYRPFI